MEEKAIRGVPWTFLAYAVNKGIRILSLMLLARLLAPSDFGLVALALASLAFVNVFSDLGLGAVLIVHQDLDQIQMGTVLSLMLITGAVAVLSLALLINVFAWFYQMLMQRELEFRRLFGCHVVQTIGYVIVTLSLAIAGAGAWSLVAGELTSGLMLSAALLIATPYRVVPALARDRVRELSGRLGIPRSGRPVIHRGERRPPDHRAPAWHRPARLLLDRLPARGDALLGARPSRHDGDVPRVLAHARAR